MRSTLDEYRTANPIALTEKMQAEILERGYDTPRFGVYDKDRGNKFLSEVGLVENIDDDKILITFNFPKPIAEWWWKGEGDWGDQGVDIGGAAVEWGVLYREILPVIWEQKDKLEYSDDAKIYLDRINGVGAHDPHKFYYIWEVGKKE